MHFVFYCCLASVWTISTISNEVNFSHSLDKVLELMKLTENMCGKLDWCTVKTANPPLDLGKSCCSKCTCDQRCHKDKSCCPDIDLSKLVDGEVFTNVTDLMDALQDDKEMHENRISDYEVSELDDMELTGCISSSLFKASRTWLSRPSYIVISRCSSVSTAASIREMCESPKFDPGHPNIGDFIPLQSNTTGTVYRNRYCALCNNVSLSDLTEWDVYLSTIFYPIDFVHLYMETMDDILAYLYEFRDYHTAYTIYFQPNKAISSDHQPCVCYNFDVESCEKDSNRASQQAETCTNYVLPTYAYINDTLTLFKNPTCVTCNGHDLHDPDVCQYYDTLDWQTHLLIRIQNAHFHRPDKVGNSRTPSADLGLPVSPKCSIGNVYDAETVSFHL